MDDISSRTDDITNAKEMQRQLIGLMKEGCFHLYKWCANSEELLKEVLTENKQFLFNENDELVKTLGLSWRPRKDRGICKRHESCFGLDSNAATPAKSLCGKSSFFNSRIDSNLFLGPCKNQDNLADLISRGETKLQLQDERVLPF
ncbi:hypothetical protein TNCT_393471 [Trichonephila clavata]|uniref:Uncharacterized protein n=1 Tax=Trichonephila clavata TaxID=2740835 RepID=A0A8X6G995_TRICU|nr:hypothetical protein TNCT_393471 [Trichonephila clavata]